MYAIPHERRLGAVRTQGDELLYELAVGLLSNRQQPNQDGFERWTEFVGNFAGEAGHYVYRCGRSLLFDDRPHLLLGTRQKPYCTGSSLRPHSLRSQPSVYVSVRHVLQCDHPVLPYGRNRR